MPRIPWLAGALVPLILTGCGKQLKVKGQLLWNGHPVQGSSSRPLLVGFCPIIDGQDRNDLLHKAVVNQDKGTFSIPGGLTPGTYRISVRQMNQGGEERFNGKFLEGSSPLLVTLHNDQNDLRVELNSP